MQQKARTAIQDRAEIEESADDVQIGDIHMPVLMGPKRLLETVTLARSLGIPALQEPGGFEYPIGAGGRDGHHITIQHHEGQPAIAFQRELMMEADNGHLFPRLQPMIARHQSVVLVGFAVTITPRVKLAPAQIDPANQLQGTDFGPFRPVCNEIHDRVANVVRHPKGSQLSPSSFFKRVCSSNSSERTSFLRCSFCSRASSFF